MKTALIGFKISRGEMDKNGEKVPYNSRTIRFITDMGQSEADAAHLGDKDDVGFSPFEAKFKLDELAKEEILLVATALYETGKTIISTAIAFPVLGVLIAISYITTKRKK